ncbi:MAG: hypothetical protein WBB96_06140, partial [Candidatus Dechloromonas phosphoritropha]
MKMKNDAERCYNFFLADLSLKMGFSTALTLEFTGPARLFTQVRWNDFLAACRTFLENHAKWDLRSEIRRNFQFYNSFERAFAQSTSEN